MTIMKSQLLNKTQILAKTLSFKHISNPIESCANQDGPLNSVVCTPFLKQWCMRQGMGMVERHLKVMERKEFSEGSLMGISQAESKAWADAQSRPK